MPAATGAQTHRRPRAMSRELRSSREVDDQHDEQDDDEDPDQSIARSGECEQHGCPISVVDGGVLTYSRSDRQGLIRTLNRRAGSR
jgi:hypothetical protein